MTAAPAIDIEGVGKTYPGVELSLRGTKLETHGPILWVRNAIRSARLTVETAGTVKALHGVGLRVSPGEVLGLLGPNGSGKTTLIKILAGLLRPTTGTGSVVGFPLSQPDAIRRRVSYVSTTGWMGLEWALSAEENLRFFAELSGMPPNLARSRADEALSDLDLTRDAAKLTSELSNGMRQRLIMARALLWRTPLVLLDEPFVGLDPDHVRQLRTLIRETLPARGQTVVVSDHQADVIEAVADRVLLLDGGRVEAFGAPADLLRRLDGLMVWDVVTELAGIPTGPQPALVRRVDRRPRPGPRGLDHWRLMLETGDGAFQAVVTWLESAGGRIVEMEERRPGLQDVVADGDSRRPESA
ncbi:MAG: ABC transporter ATP-binding protein [Clostridia bacterium]